MRVGRGTYFLVHGFGGGPGESGIRAMRSWCRSTGRYYVAPCFAGHPFLPTKVPAAPSEMVSALVTGIKSRCIASKGLPLILVGYSQGAAVVLRALSYLSSLPVQPRVVLLAPCYHLELIIQRFDAAELTRIENEGSGTKTFSGTKSCLVTKEWISDYRTFSKNIGSIPEDAIVLWGERDYTLPQSERDFFQRRVSADRFHEIPAASHNFSGPLEESSLFAVLDGIGLP